MARKMSLDHTIVNQVVRIVEISGGWFVRQRLSQLGINVGDILKIKRSGMHGGPVLIRVHDIDIALGLGIAHKIIVETVNVEGRN